MYFFFFKQKTAYEMRISDWSSDVCSSDLAQLGAQAVHLPVADNQLPPAHRSFPLCFCCTVPCGAALQSARRVGRADERRAGICPALAPHRPLPTRRSRSEERRGGKEWCSPVRSRCAPEH